MSKYPYSKKSLVILSNAHPLLYRIALDLAEFMDVTVICSYRDEKVQNEYYRTNRSKVKFPNSKHNSLPSKAIDIAPYIDGKISDNPKHFCYMAGLFIAIGSKYEVKIRWGGNWDMDQEVMTDQDFQDLYHFELIDDE